MIYRLHILKLEACRTFFKFWTGLHIYMRWVLKGNSEDPVIFGLETRKNWLNYQRWQLLFCSACCFWIGKEYNDVVGSKPVYCNGSYFTDELYWISDQWEFIKNIQYSPPRLLVSNSGETLYGRDHTIFWSYILHYLSLIIGKIHRVWLFFNWPTFWSDLL